VIIHDTSITASISDIHIFAAKARHYYHQYYMQVIICTKFRTINSVLCACNFESSDTSALTKDFGGKCGLLISYSAVTSKNEVVLGNLVHFPRVLPYFAPLPAKADDLANLSFRTLSHSLPLPPLLASLCALFSSFNVLAFSRGSITTNSSSAFFR